MTFFQRAAGRTAAALLFGAAAVLAQPALAADDDGAAVAATTGAAITPGLESLNDVVERAIAAPAAAELAAPAVRLAIPDETKVTAPVPDRSRPLELLVPDYASATPRDAQADCLASAVYFESNGEPFAGQLAVAEVIINRARSGRFASTLCGVITQRSQFSFVRSGRIPSPPRSTAAWRNAVAIAHIALDDLVDSPVASALFFHARYVSPRWRLQRLATVGNHIFYR
jgi:spore germination cell wall hydrolase CwlJ-like protein